MKQLIEDAIGLALLELRQDHPGLEPDAVKYTVQATANPNHGDWASNAAMVVAGMLEVRDRRGLAEVLAASLQRKLPAGAIARIEVAGPGFLNFFVDQSWYQQLVTEIVAADTQYGRLDDGAGQTVQIEFVSANPTGPLTVGHGRNAILGDVIARMYEAAGYAVTREYYFNNGGRQMRVLAESVRARYGELVGESVEFPEDGYRGEYILDIARALRQERGDDLLAGSLEPFKQAAETAMFADIRATCERLGIRFDVYFNELTLYDEGDIDRVVRELREKDLAYDHEGAVWYRGLQRGLERDPVLVKSTGEPTYRLPDIAYHRRKLARGFDHIVDVFGCDHIDTCQEVMNALEALGEQTDRIHVVLYQFVTLMQGGEQVKMSTRKANFVTLDDLIEEVGADAVRYFFAMRSPRSHMEFDLDLAKKQANDNPMYYVQYGHARICTMLGKPEAAALAAEPLCIEALTDEHERALITALARCPEVLRRALSEREPHRVTTYAAEVATAFHSFYDRCPVLNCEDRQVGRARLELARAAQIVLRNLLNLIGVSAPESM